MSVIVLVLALTSLYNASTPSNAQSSGQIILTFDDSYLIYSVRDNALPIMKQYGYVGVGFYPSGYLEYSWSKTRFIPAVLELVNAGWEIGSHTYSHARLNSLSYDQLVFEVTTCKRLYEELDPAINGGLGLITFAHPYALGWANETVDTIVRQTYLYARPPLIFANYPPDDPGAWGMAFTMKNEDIEAKTQEAVKFTNRTGKWAWLVFHGVGDPASYGLSSSALFVSVEKFEACLKLIKNSGVKVTTPKDYELSLIEPEPEPEPPIDVYCVTIFKNGTIVSSNMLFDIETIKNIVNDGLLNGTDLITIQLLPRGEG